MPQRGAGAAVRLVVSRVFVPGRVYGLGDFVGASGSVTAPESSAAAAVTTLNVEPGGYVWRIARFSIGLSAAPFSPRHAFATARPFPESRSGS